MSTKASDLSFNEFDDVNYPRPGETEFQKLVDKALSRRNFLIGSAMTLGAAAVGMGGCSVMPMREQKMVEMLPFEPVVANTLDSITVPRGFNWQVVARWGDPLWSNGVMFDPATRGTAESQAAAFGDNNDGMELYEHDGRLLLVVNNEYVNRSIIYGNRESKLPENADDVQKGKNGHGVTVMEIRNDGGNWQVVKDSPYNRRITADTPMDISGPARGHPLMKTSADVTGTTALGTWNNCGAGRTPWGTYLACEENFNGYFSSSDPEYQPSSQMNRYGVGLKDWGYAWATADERFDISKHPNEPNRAGYIVEIDPTDPQSRPQKRTALGRFKHENAEVTLANDGRVVVYMGDDERGEFLYKFVSHRSYVENADNRNLLEDGDLFVARFDDGGRGEWIKLTPAATGMASRAEIRVNTRIAASAVGATTMDRPEWVAANPFAAEVYCCLTNNKNRGLKPNAGGDQTPVNGPNPREGNLYGQIVKWMPDNDDHGATGFGWDLFVIAGNPWIHEDDRRGSNNVTRNNMFNSPDGLKFDSRGGMWIQTDGNYSNDKDFRGQGNNQMLLADTRSGEIKRFMVGPKECEITGICWSPDYSTMFVGIQHPGERGNSNWPDGGNSVPRSSIVAITRKDGGWMG